ncbi:MAG: hypothetical protein KGI05_07010 [Thaumarchaeota archaeon]|nr:hypothetical protein [Nitrososphaerota archaeon]
MLPVILFAILAVSGYGNINYTMTDFGNATGAILDQSTNTLEIDVSAPNNGLLALEIPRAMLDTNSTFLVLNDGNMTTYQEHDNGNFRDIIIPYMAQDERITITGTHSAPEFPIAGLLLGIGMGLGTYLVGRK